MDATNKISKDLLKAYAQSPMAFLRSLRMPGADPSKRFEEVWGDFQEEAFEKFSESLMAVAKQQPRPRRGIWLERTKGASKDSDVGCCLLWLLVFSRQPLLIELGAERAEQAEETLKAMRDVVRLNPWMTKMIKFQAHDISGERNGVICDFLTTTRTAAHGSRPHVSVCNELSHITTKHFALTMADNANKLPTNFYIIATNAGHLHTWQYELRENFRRRENWWFQKFDGQAPWIPDENIESARQFNPTIRFNRLWKGIWSPQEGDAIDPEDIDAAICLDGPMTPEEIWANDWVCVLGADAGVKHDHAALVTLAVKYGERKICLANCESWAPGPDRKIDLALMDNAIAKAQRELPLLGMCYDPMQMEFMAQRAEKLGLPVDPVHFYGKDPDFMVRALLDCFRGRFIKLYRDELLIRDLHRLCIKETTKGQYKLDAVKDDYGHADRAIALAVVLPAAALIMGREAPTDEEGAEHLITV